MGWDLLTHICVSSKSSNLFFVAAVPEGFPYQAEAGQEGQAEQASILRWPSLVQALSQSFDGPSKMQSIKLTIDILLVV